MIMEVKTATKKNIRSGVAKQAEPKQATKKTPARKAATKKVPAKKTATKKAVRKIVSMDAQVFDAKGKKKDSILLPETIFGLKWNGDLVHQVVVSMQSNARVPYAHTKDRSEVRGGGRKPWRQKGTGRARHGSNRSPIWRGGGITFGPRKEKNYTKKVNKKMRTKALYTVLSRKLRDGELVFVDSLEIADPKTKDAIGIISALAKNKGLEKLVTKPKNAALILLSDRKLNTAKSFRNIENLYVEEVRNMNPLNLLSYKYVVIEDPKKAISFLEAKINK